MNITSMLGAAVVCAFLLAGPAAAGPQQDPQADATAMVEASAIRSDFAELYAGLQEAHYDLYAHTPRAEYDRLYQETLASFDQPLTPFEVRIRFQRFVAAGRVAHAGIPFPSEAFGAYRQAGGTALPLAVRIVDGRTYVAANDSGVAAIQPGDEIVQLNDMPMSAWLTTLGRNISADNQYLNHALVELMLRPLLWLENGSPDTYRITLVKPDGRRTDVSVPALTSAETQANAAAQPPGTLELDTENRIARMLDDGIAYLRPGPFFNLTQGEDSWDPARFHVFVDEAFEQFIAAGARDVLIDLRQNQGGHDSFSNAIIAWIADEPFRFTSDFRIRISPQATAANARRLTDPLNSDLTSRRLAEAYAAGASGDIVHFEILQTQPRSDRRFTGRVWVLVDRYSFSNAVSVAAIVQDYGFGTVIGEPTADLATTYAAVETFDLTHTGISVNFPKALIIRPNGDLVPGGIQPDVVIPTPVFEGADDPVLRSALERIARLVEGQHGPAAVAPGRTAPSAARPLLNRAD